jgi:hypothetical protein
MAKTFSAVWHTGSGAQFWNTGLEKPELDDLDKKRFDQGLRLVRLQVDDGGDDCSALWRAGTGAQFWKSRRTFASFKTFDNDFFAQGLRLQSIHVDEDNRITAVWRPGSGAQFWEAGLTFSQLKDKTTAHGQNGLKLRLIARYGSDYDRYMGVWRPGAGTWFWHVGLSFDQWESITQQLLDGGFHLVYSPLWGNNGIWDKKGGFQKVLVTTNKTKFKNEDTAQFDAGRRMTDFWIGWTL